MGIFREEKIESLHAKVNITNRVLACIRRLEVRMFVTYQREELKELHRLIGQVVRRGPRSPQEVAKRKERKKGGQALEVGGRMLELEEVAGLEAASSQEIQLQDDELEVDGQEGEAHRQEVEDEALLTEELVGGM